MDIGYPNIELQKKLLCTVPRAGWTNEVLSSERQSEQKYRSKTERGNTAAECEAEHFQYEDWS